MINVLITGGTGLVGSALAKKLEERGYEVHFLTTSPNRRPNAHYWDWEQGIVDIAAVYAADYIVHLAGVGIFEKRWSDERKRLIRESRIESCRLLFNILRNGHKKPRAFISASATGYYGAVVSNHIFSENDPPARDFLAITCRHWEEAADQFAGLGIRTVKLRTGVVLSRKAGLIEKLMPLAKSGLASALGSGLQYMPWIHIDDLCGIYIKAIEDECLAGAYNAVSPASVTNAELNKTIALLLNKPVVLPKVPVLAINALYGERASVLLTGSRVSAIKISEAGYTFLFPDLKSALVNCLTNPR